MPWDEHASKMTRAEVVRAEADKLDDGGEVQGTETQFSVVPSEVDVARPQPPIFLSPPRIFGNDSSSLEEEDEATYPSIP